MGDPCDRPHCAQCHPSWATTRIAPALFDAIHCSQCRHQWTSDLGSDMPLVILSLGFTARQLRYQRRGELLVDGTKTERAIYSAPHHAAIRFLRFKAAISPTPLPKFGCVRPCSSASYVSQTAILYSPRLECGHFGHGQIAAVFQPACAGVAAERGGFRRARPPGEGNAADAGNGQCALTRLACAHL